MLYMTFVAMFFIIYHAVSVEIELHKAAFRDDKHFAHLQW